MAKRGSKSGDDGAALVEFAMVATLLMIILFAIITFGMLLAAKQTVTQGAAEASRAAIVVRYTPADLLVAESPPVAAARDQAGRSLDWIGRTCDEGDADGDGLACHIVMHDCGVDASLAAVTPNNPAVADCLTVEVNLDNKVHPLIAPIPLLNAFMPDRLRSVAVVQLDNLLVA